MKDKLSFIPHSTFRIHHLSLTGFVMSSAGIASFCMSPLEGQMTKSARPDGRTIRRKDFMTSFLYVFNFAPHALRA